MEHLTKYNKKPNVTQKSKLAKVRNVNEIYILKLSYGNKYNMQNQRVKIKGCKKWRGDLLTEQFHY